ncbi:tubulin polyglutamylase TTLL5 isoform X3 [Monomorium pharaonis]|uniref:tubulin polyglutamylase TTLL5 isoform X3 n=1 Tax=Monomorium pharaonis TaxID=307658 RepID=UPI0017467B1F|nr:tubulin polyglutamylase TTLL5 isoform X3 [Monomorium pharaonis]
MSQKKYTNATKSLEEKRSKELMSSSSLSGMSQLSNSSEEALEVLVHKFHKSDNSKKTMNTLNNEWLLNGSNGNKTPVLCFKCSALATPPENPPAKQLHMTYKISHTDTRLINLLLQSHGLIEVPISETDFNILWMGNHPKPDILRNLQPYQKINHFPRSEDPDAEDVGHKWTLSALLRHLRSMGQDTASLMQRIEDIIIKSIIATASGIVSGLKQFVKYPETCFELFGFDILIDDTLKPWLLEVNLTPSLGCDSPLDVRLKSALIADLFTLVGIAAVDPILRSQNLNHAAINSNKKIISYRRVQSAETLPQEKKKINRNNKSKAGLSSEQQRIVASAKAQFERRGGFVRIFPSPKSWELYSQYLDPSTGAPMISDPLGPRRLPQHINTNYNLMLHEQLFPTANRVTGYIIPEVTDRLSRYERYERALIKGHKQSLDRGNNKENLDVDRYKYKTQVIQSMQEGNKLSSNEARKAFSLYLGYILRKISQPNADSRCCDLVMRFLQHSSCSLKTPFLFTLPCSKLSDKDRAAITAKQLSDFLHLYNRETDLYEDTVDRPRTVPNKLFQKFLAAASEQDLDDVLILQTRLYKCAHSFLGKSGFAGNLRGANLLGFLPHITSRVYSNAAITAQCRCNNSINR